MKFTQEELAKALAQYHSEYLADPEKFGNMEGCTAEQYGKDVAEDIVEIINKQRKL